jgi:hypothetical protein
LLDLTQGQATPRAKPLSQHEHLIAPTPSLAAGWRKADARRHPPRPPDRQPPPAPEDLQVPKSPPQKREPGRQRRRHGHVLHNVKQPDDRDRMSADRTSKPDPIAAIPKRSLLDPLRRSDVGGQMTEIRSTF